MPKVSCRVLTPWAPQAIPPGDKLPELRFRFVDCERLHLAILAAAARRNNPHFAVIKPRNSALGADGRIYFGGFGERNYTGGGLGWYDAKTGKLDGFWKPLSGYMVHWIAPALAGKVCSMAWMWSQAKCCSEKLCHRASR